jgi:hypothetical protein
MAKAAVGDRVKSLEGNLNAGPQRTGLGVDGVEGQVLTAAFVRVGHA